MSLNREKYKNAILYLCQKLNGEVRGKKKLAKLLYFADFDLYEKRQKPITGDVYRALPMGPFPAMLEEVITEMVEEKKVSIEQIAEHDGYLATEIYKSGVEPNLSVFDDEEKKMLDRIAVRYGHLNGKQLEDLSHAEAPFVGTKIKEEIPFELAFYRDTDFSDL